MFKSQAVFIFVVLAIIQDVRIFWPAGSLLVTTVAFWAGAWRRLNRSEACG